MFYPFEWTFYKFALAFSMLQVSNSYPYKHKKWVWNKSVTEKSNVYLEKKMRIFENLVCEKYTNIHAYIHLVKNWNS